MQRQKGVRHMTDKDILNKAYNSLEEHRRNTIANENSAIEFINENKLLLQRQCYKIYLQTLCKRKGARHKKSNTLLRMILERDYS